jgi:hypothetical protein
MEVSLLQNQAIIKVVVMDQVTCESAQDIMNNEGAHVSRLLTLICILELVTRHSLQCKGMRSF